MQRRPQKGGDRSCHQDTSKMSDIIVIGGGGHGKVILTILKKLDHYNILGYFDPKDRGSILNVPYLGDDFVMKDIIDAHRECAAVLGLGMMDPSGIQKREALFSRLKQMGFSFPPIVSPNSTIHEDVKIREATVVIHHSVINTGTRIGRSCIINTNCSIDHDCSIGDNVHIAPGVTMGGGINIGNNCMIGIGATIVNGIRLAAGCFISAGTVVTRDIEKPGIYRGNPARMVKLY